MRVKGNTYKASQPPLRTIVVEQDGKLVTHIYRSRESFRLDELARYKRRVFRQMAVKYQSQGMSEALERIQNKWAKQ